nr:hypothetical protein CFP56_57714 [Quercus suber]
MATTKSTTTTTTTRAASAGVHLGSNNSNQHPHADDVQSSTQPASGSRSEDTRPKQATVTGEASKTWLLTNSKD